MQPSPNAEICNRNFTALYLSKTSKTPIESEFELWLNLIKAVSTCSIFKSSFPVHTDTWKRFENANLLFIACALFALRAYDVIVLNVRSHLPI